MAFKLPVYNLLRYELNVIDDNSSIRDVYNALCKRYAGYEREIFQWFEELDDHQIENIFVRMREYSPSRGIVSKGYIMHQGTIHGYVVCRVKSQTSTNYMFR